MISRDDVVCAYRLFFDREPESEAVVAHYAAEVSTLRALRELFLNSSEFRQNYEAAMPPRPPRVPFNGPPMQVEMGATPEQLTELFAKIGAQWEHLGQTEPHWSVLTNESYFQQNFQMNREAFFASGESELQMFDATLARAGVDRSSLQRVVELGCGVGRVTIGLAARFEQVLGMDVSAAHLEVAQAHVQGLGLTNLRLSHLQAMGDVAALAPYDVLYSRMVLQHNPPPVAARLLRDLLAGLRPGGVAFLQLPTYRAGYRFTLAEYLRQQNTTEMEMHYLPQAVLLDLLAEQGCRVLELREDDAIGLSVIAVSNTLLVQKVAP